MLEGYFLGMEVKSAGWLVAIERVAKDRGVQALLVGTMHSQLVRSASLGIEG